MSSDCSVAHVFRLPPFVPSHPLANCEHLMRLPFSAYLLVLLSSGLGPNAPALPLPHPGAFRRLPLVQRDTDRIAFSLDRIIDHGDNSFTRICRLAHQVALRPGKDVDGFMLDQVFDEDGNLFTNDKTVQFTSGGDIAESTTFHLHNDNDFNDNRFVWHFTEPATDDVWIEEHNAFESGYLVHVN